MVFERERERVSEAREEELGISRLYFRWTNSTARASSGVARVKRQINFLAMTFDTTANCLAQLWPGRDTTINYSRSGKGYP